MGTFARRSKEPAVAGPERPDKLIPFLWELSGEPRRAFCFVAIISVVVVVCCAGLALIAWAAERGMTGLGPGFVLPGGILGGGWALAWVTSLICKKLRSRPAGSASDGRKSGPR